MSNNPLLLACFKAFLKLYLMLLSSSYEIPMKETPSVKSNVSSNIVFGFMIL